MDQLKTDLQAATVALQNVTADVDALSTVAPVVDPLVTTLVTTLEGLGYTVTAPVSATSIPVTDASEVETPAEDATDTPTEA